LRPSSLAAAGHRPSTIWWSDSIVRGMLVERKEQTAAFEGDSVSGRNPSGT